MGGDIGDVNLKRTVEEIKRLQEEASSLRQENIQLKVSVPDDTFKSEFGVPFVPACSWVGFSLTRVYRAQKTGNRGKIDENRTSWNIQVGPARLHDWSGVSHQPREGFTDGDSSSTCSPEPRSFRRSPSA